MNEAQALLAFRKWVDRFPLKQDAAADLGISAPYLVDLYRGRRPITDRLLAHIGLVRTVTIRRRTA